MNITLSKVDKALIASVEGRLDAETSSDMETQLNEAIEKERSSLILDLDHLEYISSAGLRVILSLAKKVKTSGKAFMLCSLQDSVEQVFEISGFVGIMKIVADKEAALGQI
ncbi:MAG: STAS domain-containing protein [Phycisphaeraceae bacterium]|nr:STAS domain-containing protein [Phycisphaeraceae bacterium]